MEKGTILNLLALWCVGVAIKVLLIPAYFSTDFDVHQNWLRITSTKNISEWYYNDQSKWTLDYPPLFAFFQYILAKISTLINPAIALTINKNLQTIYFQRMSVIISQLPFLVVLYLLIRKINAKLVIAYLSIPFVILDNIHFQYNIIMQAIFLLSIYFIQKQCYIKGAFTYSCLLNFKHIYLYAGLAFFANILKNYVLKPSEGKQKMTNLIKVGIATITPFIIAFLPFFLIGGIQQIKQILSRLFPFQRGLIHEYWAPNFWALYHFLDKLLNAISSRFFISSRIDIQTESTDLHRLKVLPEIAPLITTILILLFSIPILVKSYKCNVRFHRLVFICGMTFFMFGYHVHEKAITPYISLLFIFMSQKPNKKYNFINSAIFVNMINLLPLLIDENQKLLRILLPILWITIWDFREEISNYLQGIICALGMTYLFYHQIAHPFVNRFEFLPLMINSIFSATFNLCWLNVIYYRQLVSQSQSSSPINQHAQYRSVNMIQEQDK